MQNAGVGSTLDSRRFGPLTSAYGQIGWEDMGVQLHRAPKYHVILPEYTAELGFVKEHKAYLSRAMGVASMEARNYTDSRGVCHQQLWLDLTHRSETAMGFRY